WERDIIHQDDGSGRRADSRKGGKPRCTKTEGTQKRRGQCRWKSHHGLEWRIGKLQIEKCKMQIANFAVCTLQFSICNLCNYAGSFAVRRTNMCALGLIVGWREIPWNVYYHYALIALEKKIRLQPGRAMVVQN